MTITAEESTEQIFNALIKVLKDAKVPKSNDVIPKVAAMMKRHYDVGRETMKVNIAHAKSIARADTDRMTRLKHWLKKIDQALATKNSPLSKILADTSRQVGIMYTF